MKRILLLIPLALCGCSQDREERRETVKNCLLAPIALAGMILDSQPNPDPNDFAQSLVDQQNSGQPGGYTVAGHLPGASPDVPK